jgi:hypothetical protein
MPLESIHKFAFKAAQAARCAGEQGKYWEMHDRLFENQKALEPWTPHAEAVGLDIAKFDTCLASGKFDSEIRRDMSEARKAGVTGTPAFMIGRTDPASSQTKVLAVLKGAKAFGDFKVEIDGLLEAIEKGTLEEPVVAVPSPPVTPRRTASPAQTRTLDAMKVAAMQAELVSAPAGSPAWIVAPRTDPDAIAQAEDLAKVFASAGWKVEPVGHSDVNVRPGMYLFAGDDQPPAYVDTVRQALESGGFAPTVGLGYRKFYAEKVLAQPGFRGFPFADGQTFVIVVGRIP